MPMQRPAYSPRFTRPPKIQAITILVTHRLANLVSATRIFVLDDGRIAESGTHNELLALGGQYRQIFDIQARAYQTTLEQPKPTSSLC
jgi:ABC-type transport system involved in cytochrome bd biosynthesis fused ATPase/permease subunit